MRGCAVLLADFDVVRNMGHRFQGKNAQLNWNDLFMLLAIVLAVAVAAWLLARVTRRERSRRTNSPRGLFLELCQAHQLDRQSRSLLWRLAKHQELSHPARVFVDPERFEPGQLPELLPAQAQRLENVRQQLFAEDAVEATTTIETGMSDASEARSADVTAQ